MVGLPDRVEVVPYNPAWSSDFEAESERVFRALGDNIVSVHHMRSTAVPGMLAKPTVDILLEVNDLVRLDGQTGAMDDLGHKAMGELGVAGRRYFRKSNCSGVRTHHVHAFQAGSAEIERFLAFRDYVMVHPAEAQEYGALKRELARPHPDDRQAYINGKDEFVNEHEAKALSGRRSSMGK